MSDGDSATPGHGAPDGGDDGDHQLMTLAPPERPAPWERWQNSAPEPPAAPRRSGSRRRNGGNGSVSVADLIARVNADAPPSGGRRRRRAAGLPPQTLEAPAPLVVPEPEPESDRLPVPDIAEAPAPAPSPDIAEVAYPSELPDLDRIHGTTLDTAPDTDWDAAAATVELPDVEHEIPPVRIDPHRRTATEQSEPPRAAPHRRAKLAGRAVAAMLAIFTLVLTGSAWQWSSTKNRSLNHVSALDPGSHDILDAAGQYGDENFLIVGADTRAGANSDIGAGSVEDAEGARSDTIMLVNIPANRKRVVVVSFPRDLAITPIECDVWNAATGVYGPIYDEETGTYSDETVYTETKLNSTYAYGGPKCLVKEIQKLSGLAINRFMAVDFVGFGKMVDALGGVEVCTPSPLYDLELGSVLENPGRQRVNGATALNYVRARNVTTEDNGDYGRIKRQQLFLSSLLRSLISTNTFFSPTKLNNVVNMFIGDSSVDNITTKDLVNLGQSLQKVSAGHITFVTVPTSETDENGDEVPRMDDMRALFDAIINDDPLPGENDHNATSVPTTTTGPTTASSSQPAAPSSTAKPPSERVRAVTTSPGTVTVRVSNATEQTGLAGATSTELQQWGFNVDNADDYPGIVKTTKVLFSPGNEQAAATVSSALSGAPIERVSGLGSIVRVVLGSDFRAVSKPAAGGSTINVILNRGANVEPTELPDDLTVTNAADTTCE
ncbi:LCP family protein [[Mycobacterium] kokjensenii]|uniref:LCP family protein n=1 Tax=[Mycobacterium] kokjensenii TaxID=3064287 RepID=A0ABM9LS11_9MYCO|nr:LCP family protein [Mycolicibacter sp. MU0083]CAJ1503770.1 LCP family protein [Mycolicibacter sp. MU0083]